MEDRDAGVLLPREPLSLRTSLGGRIWRQNTVCTRQSHGDEAGSDTTEWIPYWAWVREMTISRQNAMSDVAETLVARREDQNATYISMCKQERKNQHMLL